MLKLITDSDPRLREPARSMRRSDVDGDFYLTMLDMVELMKKHDGIGLAAVQVGIDRAFFVLANSPLVRICINPAILSYGETRQTISEGCLSFPGLYLNIERPNPIEVEYRTTSWETVRETLTGIDAIAFQHEFDHLCGEVFTENYSSVKRLVPPNDPPI